MVTVPLPFVKRDAIVENHKKRRAQLSKLLGDTKDKVAAHESGEYLLEGDEYETLKKRIGLYEKKVRRSVVCPTTQTLRVATSQTVWASPNSSLMFTTGSSNFLLNSFVFFLAAGKDEWAHG